MRNTLTRTSDENGCVIDVGTSSEQEEISALKHSSFSSQVA
jgi:hypothetical protein